MTMESYLDDRKERNDRAFALAQRDGAARVWLHKGKTAEERLLAFDRWVAAELALRIDWTWAGAARGKRIQQCRIELDRLFKELADRGWNIDGRRLAVLVCEALDEIAVAQKAGRVQDFWPFFRSVVGRYVGTHAEEIQDAALSMGNHVGQVFQALVRQAPATATIPELVRQRSQERLTDRVAKQRAKEAKETADKAQLPLL